MGVGEEATRVGIVSFLNSWPLAWAFLTGRHEPRFAPRFLRPSLVADHLQSGAVDIGLIPSAELQRIADLRVIPGLCVASDQEVTSVLLVSKVPVEQIRRVGLDTSSRTSAVLVQILLAARGIDATFHPVEPQLEGMLRDNDATLLIGDPALEVDRERYAVLDLASEWRNLTGLPFVFAVWAVRREVAAPGLVEAFSSSLELGLEEIEEIVARAHTQLGLPADRTRRYLTRHLQYRLGRAELASLEEFFRRGHALGLLPQPRSIEFLAPSTALA